LDDDECMCHTYPMRGYARKNQMTIIKLPGHLKLIFPFPSVRLLGPLRTFLESQMTC